MRGPVSHNALTVTFPIAMYTVLIITPALFMSAFFADDVAAVC